MFLEAYRTTIKTLKSFLRPKIIRKAWSWVSRTSSALLDMATRSEYSKEDDVAKWFGLYIESSKYSRKICDSVCQQCKASVPEHRVIVEETGVGKSTLSKLAAHTFTTKFVLMFCGFVLKTLSPYLLSLLVIYTFPILYCFTI